jgi:hypothetical protein
MPNNDVLLATLNNIAHYDLKSLLDLTFGDSRDSNPYIDNKTNTEYYELLNPPTCVTDQNNTVLLSLNIRSLMSNHEELSKMIQNLTKAGANIGELPCRKSGQCPTLT